MTVESGAAEAPVILTADRIVAAAPKIGEDTIDVPEWGTALRLRGIGKREQRKIQDDSLDAESGKVDEDVVEMSMFLHGVIEPTFTDEQVEELWKTAPGPINRVLLRILDLSGASPKADLTAVRTFPKGSDAAVRVRAGPRSGDAPRRAAHAARRVGAGGG